MCAQVMCEIRRSIVKTGDDPRTNVGDQPPFDLVKDALFVDGAHMPPVDGQLAQMRHRCKRIESGMSLRRTAWVSDCRELGKASCRERVCLRVVLGGGRSIKKNLQ